jgi:Rieske 2Fe-2S family protein
MGERAPIDPALLERSSAPFPAAVTLPAVAYTSPQVFAWEQERFLEGSWYCVGRSDLVPRPGDQAAVRVGAEAVALVRGRDELLRAFFNTCRHRGHELLPCGEEAINRSFVRCPYHSWTYGLDGRFKTAPGFAGRPGFDPTDAEHGLMAVRLEEWAGWAFVNCSADAPALGEHVGNLDEALGPYEPERLRLGARVDYDVRANWKVVGENYHECYHCENIHPELCRVTPPDSGVQFEPTGLVVGGSMDLMEHAETMSLDGRSLGVAFRGLDAQRRREVHYFQMLPNLFVAPHPDYVVVHRLEPLAEDRTRIECTWLFPPEAWEREGFDPGYAVEFWDLTNRQDWAACEGVQRGASGRGYRQGPLSEAEEGVRQVVALMARGYLEGGFVLPSRAGEGGVQPEEKAVVKKA